MEFIIRPNSTNPKKNYNISENEETFLNAFVKKLNTKKLKILINLSRLADGTINVNYAGYPIGKIKLQGKNTYMFILKTLYKVDEVNEVSLNEYIDKLDDWIKYIKNYILK